MPDSRKKLYDAISNDYDLGTFEEFNSKMDIPESRKKLYESVSADFDLGTFDEFELKVGAVKKKEPTYPGLKDAFGISLRGPLMEKSNLPQTTKKVKQPLKSDLKVEELKSIETNLAKENVELSQIKQKLTALEKSGNLQDPSVQAEYNGLVNQYNERQKSAKTQLDKYHKEHGNYRTLVRDEQNADLKKGINTSKGVLNKINTYDATLRQVGLRYGQTQVALEEALQAGDNEAAAQLQGQLKKDEAIIKNLDELIKTGKRVAASQEEDSFGNNINIGMYQALGTILQSQQGLTKAALTPIMEYGMKMDPVQRELMFRTLAKLDPNMMASETLGEFGGEVSKFAEERKQKANMNRLYNGSAYNALLKGDVTKAVTYAAKDFANSLPSSTMYATGAGAALMSAGMVGDEIRKTEEETGQAIGSKEVLTASIKAGLEVVTERMFGDGKAAVELVKKLGKEGAERAISTAVKEITKKGLGRKIAENAGEEVIGESINQIGANAADIYINGKKDVSLWDGVGDAAIIALVGGGTYGGALTTANHYIDKARIKESEDLKVQAANYMEQSLLQQNPAAAQVLEEKANTLNLEAQNIVDREQEIALNANPETMDAIIALENDKEQLEEALQEEGLPEEVSAVIEEKLSTLQVEHNELIVQATKEAEQNIKAEEEEISQPIDVTEFLKGEAKEEIVPLIDEGNNTEVVEPQDQKRSEKVEEPAKEEVVSVKEQPQVETEKPILAEITPSENKDALRDVESTTKALEKNKKGTNNIKGEEYYHGTSLPKSEDDFTTFNKNKGVGVRSNAFMGDSREQKSPFFFITSEKDIAQDFAQAKADYNNEKLNTKEKHTLRIIPFKFDESKSKILDLTKDDYEQKLEQLGFNPIDDYGLGMYDESMMWEYLDNPNFYEKLKSEGYDAVKYVEPKRGIGVAILNTDKIVNSTPKGISEAYHKAKQDGSNPELVQAVEELLTNKQQEDAISKGKQPKDDKPEYQGIDGQQQGEQEDRTNQEGNEPQSETETINRNQSTKSRKEQKVVLDEGNGVILNDLFNQWNNIKNEKDLSKWEDKVRSIKFGTYGTIGLIETLNKFDIKINEVSKRNFYNDIESALNIPINQRTYAPNKITKIEVKSKLTPDEAISNLEGVKEKVDYAEKTIDDAAEWLKNKLKIDLPEGTKRAGIGITDEQLIDLIAKAAKKLAKGAIVTVDYIKKVLDTLKEGGFLEGIDVKPIIVYHGGDVYSLDDINESNPLYVSESKSQAKEYAKGNEGVVTNFLINKNRIATEEKAFETIEKLGLKTNENSGYTNEELNLFELIDWVNFKTTSIGEKGVKLLFETLAKEGFGGIEFYDTNLITLKEDIKNIVIFNEDAITNLSDSAYVKLDSNIKVEDVVQRIEKLKLDTKGKLNAFGIAPAIWNAGLDTIILAIKSGVALADAVQQGIQFFKDKNVEFDEAKVTAHLEEKVGIKRTQPKDKPIQNEEGQRKIRRHFKTIVNNESLKEATKFMLENDFAYNVKSMDRSLSRAKAYLEKNGIEDSYTNFITYGEKIEGLTGDEAIALAFLIQTMINSSMIKEAESGNQELADALNDDFYRMSEKIAEIGTEAGRIVNAFNLFILDMSNPISAQMALNRIAKKAENEAKASDSKERKKAESKTKAVTNEVNKGKRKTTQEVVKYAEQITKEDEELGDIIFKGSKKPISDETKAKISNFFDSLKSDSKNKTLSSIIPGGPIIWDTFVDAVKKLVVDGGIPLTNAIAKAYSDMASTTDKKTLDEVRDAFVKEAGVNPQQVAKRIQAQKKKESERLQKEKDTLEKELQKERDRVAKLRAKEKESQQARIEEQSAKLALQEAKDAQKAVEKQLEADRVEKQKTLSKAKKEALDIELKAAEQKQKDAQKVLDLADAMALKTIQNELKESQKKEKQLEKDIEKLGKELVRNRLFDDLVADLVDEYINMKGDTKNEDLIKLVEERLGVKGDKAFKIANKIRESVYNNVTKRVSDRFERDIETEKKRREGTLKKADPKTGEQIVDELVFAINTRMMTADMMMDLFPSKYGMVNFTGEDFKKVRELSQAIATAPSAERKAIAIKNFLEYLYSFKPYYFAELMNELWYFDVLSGVLTIALSTGDVNNYYNFVQVASMAKEIPAVAVLQGVRRAFNEKKYNQIPSILSDVLMSFTKAMMQTLVRPTDNEVKTANSWVKLAFKNKTFLNESRAAFEEAFTKGTASFTDFENPFKNSALGEFDILRVWDGAKKNLTKDKKGLAYLYWLAVEKVYNVGSAAWRLLANGPKGFIGLNQIVPQVGRTLAASDVFFSGIIKNGYSAIVLREQLIKEGFKGAELEAELTKRITNSEEEMAAAKYTAINWRMKYDIGFQQNSDGKWNIYDDGKAVSKITLKGKTPLEFDTLEEAEDYAKTVVAPSGSRYKLDVMSQLNLKRGMAAIRTEKRIASFNLLTKASMGRTGQLLSFFNKMSQFFTELSKEISESASLSDKRAIRYAKNILATSVIYATHLFSFLKVGTGLSRMFSQYFTPIGLLRGFMADKYNKSLLGRNLDEEVSKVEVDMLYAKALMGLYPTYLVLNTMLRLKDDEDDDKEKKEVVITPEEEKFIANIEKRFGVKLDEKQKKLVTMVKPGDVVGNLQWMDPTMRRFFTNTKILVESSRFLGYDENGNRLWEGLSQDPSMIMAESYATMVWYNHLNKDKQDASPITELALHPLYKFIDLSIGQGIVKYFASKTTTENKFEALFQTLVLDMGGIFNPNILTGVMKYVDGKARKNESLFDYIDNQEDRNYFSALGAYTLDKVVPVKGAWYEATQAPIVYGQFGEEMFRVPSEKQGFFSSMLGYYNNKDKNLEQKAMNEFFYSIGRFEVYVPDKSQIIDENFKKHKLTPRQMTEYGMLAGRVSFEQFKKLTPIIQELYSKVGEKAANSLIDDVFVSNYKNMALFKLGLISQKDFDRLSTENIANQMSKALNKLNVESLEPMYYEALNVTEKEKQLIEDMKKVTNSDNKKAIFLKEMSKLKSEEEIIPYLERMLTLKVMSSEMFNELFNYKYLNGKIGANIPQRLEELETQEED